MKCLSNYDEKTTGSLANDMPEAAHVLHAVITACLFNLIDSSTCLHLLFDICDLCAHPHLILVLDSYYTVLSILFLEYFSAHFVIGFIIAE